jgi:hypothetical protein
VAGINREIKVYLLICGKYNTFLVNFKGWALKSQKSEIFDFLIKTPS